jgi:hypothetical protein
MLPEFVRIAGRSYEVILVGRLRRRGAELPWVVCHRTRRVFLSRRVCPCDRREALDYAVSSGRRLVAALLAD